MMEHFEPHLCPECGRCQCRCRTCLEKSELVRCMNHEDDNGQLPAESQTPEVRYVYDSDSGSAQEHSPG
jgi:hypothetical protein